MLNIQHLANLYRYLTIECSFVTIFVTKILVIKNNDELLTIIDVKDLIIR